MLKTDNSYSVWIKSRWLQDICRHYELWSNMEIPFCNKCCRHIIVLYGWHSVLLHLLLLHKKRAREDKPFTRSSGKYIFLSLFFLLLYISQCRQSCIIIIIIIIQHHHTTSFIHSAMIVASNLSNLPPSK